jgi:hypothetical protein
MGLGVQCLKREMERESWQASQLVVGDCDSMDAEKVLGFD